MLNTVHSSLNIGECGRFSDARPVKTSVAAPREGLRLTQSAAERRREPADSILHGCVAAEGAARPRIRLQLLVAHWSEAEATLGTSTTNTHTHTRCDDKQVHSVHTHAAGLISESTVCTGV